MGILNVTPDSFSDGGRYLDPEKAVQRALELESQGADLLDIGAESTRPGAPPVPTEEQLRRLLPVLKALRRQIRIPLSIDTTQAAVAFPCLEEGAAIINDVSGLRDDGTALAHAVCNWEAGLILMHRRGNAQTMQSLAHYDDVVTEVLTELKESVQMALDAGLSGEQLVIDPGLGFAKDTKQNLEILSGLARFKALGYPVLLGPSRKSFLGVLTGRSVERRDFATVAVVAYAVLAGVQVIRVHDVAAARDAVLTVEAIRQEQAGEKGVGYVRTF